MDTWFTLTNEKRKEWAKQYLPENVSDARVIKAWDTFAVCCCKGSFITHCELSSVDEETLQDSFCVCEGFAKVHATDKKVCDMTVENYFEYKGEIVDLVIAIYFTLF